MRPKPRLTLEECAPLDVDAQEAFFLQHGFICFLNVLSPEQLSRAQAAWAGAQPAVQEEWEAKGRPDGFFDIPNLLELDDVFIDLIDSPTIVPMMSRVTGFEAALDPEQSVGSASTTGCMRVGGMSGRVVPKLDPEADGYTWWHNDMARPDDWAMPAYRNVKLFFWLWDVPMGGGATCALYACCCRRAERFT